MGWALCFCDLLEEPSLSGPLLNLPWGELRETTWGHFRQGQRKDACAVLGPRQDLLLLHDHYLERESGQPMEEAKVFSQAVSLSSGYSSGPWPECLPAVILS